MTKQPEADPSDGGKAAAGKPKDPTSSGNDGEPEDEGKNPATLADLATHKKEIQGLLATQYQGVQSLLDRQGESLKTAMEPVSRFNATLESMGIEVTDEQKEQLRQAEVMYTLTQGEQSNGKTLLPGETTQETDPTKGSSLSPTQQMAVAMMEQTGIRLNPADAAELALIDQETTDLQVFGASFKAALDAKVQRLAGVEADTGEEETKTDVDGKPKEKGPGLNARGKGSKNPSILPEERPGGAKTTSLDFLSAGYQESEDFPAAE